MGYWQCFSPSMRCTLQSTQGISFVLAHGCPVGAGDSMNYPNLQLVITY